MRVSGQVDSVAASGAALKLASPRPVMTAIAAEISLWRKGLQSDALLVDHVCSAAKVWADTLSRLSEGKAWPVALIGVERAAVPSRANGFYMARPSE